jgi:hypothetical protein
MTALSNHLRFKADQCELQISNTLVFENNSNTLGFENNRNTLVSENNSNTLV